MRATFTLQRLGVLQRAPADRICRCSPAVRARIRRIEAPLHQPQRKVGTLLPARRPISSRRADRLNVWPLNNALGRW
jgi:hypothetical protein